MSKQFLTLKEIGDDWDKKPVYRITVKCTNCRNQNFLFIAKGVKINPSHLNWLACPSCEVKKTLKQVEWHHGRQEYV